MAIDPTIPIEPGDIFWIALPRQGGQEQHGRRPCIVISRRAINVGNPIVVVPMTTNTTRANSYNIMLPVSEIIKDINCTSVIQNSVALVSQVRAVDKNALD